MDQSGPLMRVKMPPDYEQGLGQRARPVLSVDDIAKLAGAGIKMGLEDIVKYLPPPEPPQKAPGWFNQNRLLQPLIERWRNGQRQQPNNDFLMDRELEATHFPFHLSAWCENDLVYLFVAGHGVAPCIIEDEQYVFPSDALMVKLRILDKQRKPAQQQGAQQQGVGMIPVQNKVRNP